VLYECEIVDEGTREARFEGFAFAFSSPGTAELSGGRVRFLHHVMVCYKV
jgi:hypothetical protein